MSIAQSHAGLVYWAIIWSDSWRRTSCSLALPAVPGRESRCGVRAQAWFLLHHGGNMHRALIHIWQSLYLASFRIQFRHIALIHHFVSYLPERGLTIHETAGLSFHVLFCSETAGLSFHVLFCSESDLTLVSRQHSCSHLNVIITAVAARYQRE